MEKRRIPIVRHEDSIVNLGTKIYKLEELYRSPWRNQLSTPHRLNFNALIYISAGEGVHCVDNKTYKLTSGSIVAISQNQIHYFSTELSLEGYVITFENHFLLTGLNDPHHEVMSIAMLEVNHLLSTDRVIGLFFAQLHEEYNATDCILKVEVIRHLVRLILLKSIVPHFNVTHQNMQNSPSDDFLRLKNYIDTHFECRPSKAQVAKGLGKSVKQLDKLATESAHCTVKELVDTRVIVEAKRLLAFSQFSISEIATQLGFNEPTNMTKFFKRHTEMSPKDYRMLCHSDILRRL
ncbi:AraC family transcriptional regulator [Vibrio kyushuensis]|uniref:AraC family transcriptional regulator n=1 Tax=Vibrio kyushuensis TaxID=2910249 RepID=UPI003D107A15